MTQPDTSGHKIIITDDIFVKAAMAYCEITGKPLNVSNFGEIHRMREKIVDFHAMYLALKTVGAL